MGRQRKLHCFANNVVYRVFLVPAQGEHEQYAAALHYAKSQVENDIRGSLDLPVTCQRGMHDGARSIALLSQIRDSFRNFDKAVKLDTGIHVLAPPRNTSFYHFRPLDGDYTERWGFN